MLERLLNKMRILKTRTILKKLDRKNIIPDIRNRKLSYLSDNKFIQIISTLNDINNNRIEGMIIEAGCALGGSLVVLEQYSQAQKIKVYDTFEMIPAPTENDPPEVHERYQTIISGKSEGIGGDVYYGYRKNLLEFVRQQLKDFGGTDAVERTELIKGLLQDTMNIDANVALAHIDVDWYEPVKYCIEKIWPEISAGGSMIFDDYFDWGGCKKAVDEFFKARTDYLADASKGNYKITKTYP